MNCFNCGTHLEQSVFCPECGIDVRTYRKIMMASNAYYNDGLEKANVRDLSGAVESLKMSLRFNKRNTEARNLLGLVYFEMGEVVAALTEWVISKNYQPEENRSGYYLNEIQQNKGRLESINQTIKKYNQALIYCRQNNRDMAMIQLKKVLSLNPKLVAGHQLLALLYIQEKKFDLAKKSLRNAGKIDVNNKRTLRYLKEANAGMREQNPNKKAKKDEHISYQSGNEIIIQPKYLKDTSAFSTIINMVIGIVIGVAITGFLVVPGVRSTIQQEAKAQVLEANNLVSSKEQTIASLETQIEGLNTQITEMYTQGETASSRVNSYDSLLQAYLLYENGDVNGAGTALEQVNVEYLSESVQQVYNTVRAGVNKEYLATLYTAGYQAYAQKNYEVVIENMKKIIEIEETYQNGNALYYLAQSYRKQDDLEGAKPYYQRIIDLYPNTDRAANAARYMAQ